MIGWFQSFWLAVLQGFTEFLPISSSGHLALIPWLLDWSDQGLSFDVAVHVGTLFAVCCYFRRDLKLLIRDWTRSVLGGPVTAYSTLAWSIGIATIFVGLAGLMFEDLISHSLRHPIPIAIATLFFGIMLGIADRLGAKQRRLESIRWPDVLVIGIAQMLALIPGTSRSGITITAGLMMGLTRDAAARFSFLLAIPVIALAGFWQGLGLLEAEREGDWGKLVLATVVSAAVALLCIHYFLKFIQRFGLMPFVIYRLILGVILLWVFM